MVRTKALRDLNRVFDTGKRSIDIHNYIDQAFDVAFEITTADTFIAGIASKILDRERVTKADRKILNDVRLSGTDWRCDDGELFNLEPYPEINTAARGVEELRAQCRQALELAD